MPAAFLGAFYLGPAYAMIPRAWTPLAVARWHRHHAVRAESGGSWASGRKLIGNAQ